MLPFRISREQAAPGAGENRREMGEQHPPTVNVFPAIEDDVFVKNGMDKLFRELPSNGAAMLMMNDAGGLVEHLPAALPSGIP